MLKNKKPYHFGKLILIPLFLIGTILGIFLYHNQLPPISPSPQNTSPVLKPSPTLPTSIPTPSSTPDLNQNIWFDVPFTSQAPLKQWDDPLQQDGCEEASSLMAVSWARGETLDSPQNTLDKLKDISLFQQQTFDNAIDTSAQDTLTRIIQGYFDHQSSQLLYPVHPSDLVKALAKGQLIIAPMNGRLLGNPYFTAPGPERHMLVIIGFDPKTNQFITNDPGTRKGKNYRYQEQVLWQAIRDYDTGDHQPITKDQKVVILIDK